MDIFLFMLLTSSSVHILIIWNNLIKNCRSDFFSFFFFKLNFKDISCLIHNKISLCLYSNLCLLCSASPEFGFLSFFIYLFFYIIFNYLDFFLQVHTFLQFWFFKNYFPQRNCRRPSALSSKTSQGILFQ